MLGRCVCVVTHLRAYDEPGWSDSEGWGHTDRGIRLYDNATGDVEGEMSDSTVVELGCWKLGSLETELVSSCVKIVLHRSDSARARILS